MKIDWVTTWVQLHLPADPVSVKVGVPPALLRAHARRRGQLPPARGHSARTAVRWPHEGDPEKPLWGKYRVTSQVVSKLLLTAKRGCMGLILNKRDLLF